MARRSPVSGPRISDVSVGVAMGWKPTGRPTVRQQRDRWVVRVDGIDTESGKHRPRQLGTLASRRSAQRAASAFTESGDVGSDHGTVGALVDRWVAGRIHVSAKSQPAVPIGSLTDQTGPRRHPGRPPRPGGCRRAELEEHRQRWSLRPAQHHHLSHGPARSAGRRRGHRRAATQPCGSSWHATSGDLKPRIATRRPRRRLRRRLSSSFARSPDTVGPRRSS